MNKIKKLQDEILKHKRLYYSGFPLISDKEFDDLENQLRQLDPDNFVLKVVGTEGHSGEKIRHETRMLSLDKTYKQDELLNWISDKEVVSVFKIDGVSCSLIYEDGKLLLGKTRGDGQFGENITAKIYWIPSVPKNIAEKDQMEIRGELYCDQESFILLGNEMQKQGLERPSSLRNIVAGLVGRKDNIELSQYLSFRAFDVIMDEKEFQTENQKLDYLRASGFIVPEYRLHKNGDSIVKALVEAQEFMSEGDYQIDGLVFVYNDISLHVQLGETAHHPRYKLAYKFVGESRETEIKEIIWSVSRNGVLTPVANVVPVQLAGAMISRVTLHNFAMMKYYNLKKGDKIEIIRSGEVIPKFVSVVEESKNEFIYPLTCPECHSSTTVESIRLYCTNDQCPAKNREQILNFIQKIGISDLSEKRLNGLINLGSIQKISDVYRLSLDDLMNVEKIKEKLAQKLLSSIQESKKADLPTFLSALGIAGGAYNTCKKITDAGIDTIEKVMDLTVEKLIEIESFAEKSANDFINSLHDKKDLIIELGMLGFQFQETVKLITPLTGKRICITGSLSEKRQVIEKKLRNIGATIVSSVGKDTDYLLTNEKESSSSKFKKAKELGVRIVNEEEVNKMMAN